MSEDLKLDPVRTAVIAIDLQQGIVGMDTQPYGTDVVVERGATLLAAARSSGAMRVLVHVGGYADGADRLRPEADEVVPAGGWPQGFSDFVPQIAPRVEDLVIFKRQWGSFYGTDLDLQLRRRGIETLVLCGISTEFGVESTARDAYERGYRLVLVEDAMTGRSKESHDNATRRIFPRIGLVRRTETVLTAFQSPR